MGEEWFWQGTGGALIGAFLAGVVAVVAILLTRRHERALLRAGVSIKSAQDCWAYLEQLEYPSRFAPLEEGWSPTTGGFGQAVDFASGSRSVWRRLATFAVVIDDPTVTVAVMDFADRVTGEYANRFRAAAQAESREQLQAAVDDYLADLSEVEEVLWVYLRPP